MTIDPQNLKKAGLKATLPRIKILEILEHSEKRHMSAEELYKTLLEAGEDVGLATIYRVLTQFVMAGLVHRSNFDGGHAVYELSTITHHDHMVCIDSGEVIEFCDEEIERRQREIAEEKGFILEGHNLTLFVRRAPSEK